MELRDISAIALARIHPIAGGPGVAPLRILIQATEQRRVVEAVWAAGGEIVSLTPVRRRLEDLFLEWSADRAGDAGRTP